MVKQPVYGGLAESINNPKAVRAVGGAVGSNPISIIIPCHRVLGEKNVKLPVLVVDCRQNAFY